MAEIDRDELIKGFQKIVDGCDEELKKDTFRPQERQYIYELQIRNLKLLVGYLNEK